VILVDTSVLIDFLQGKHTPAGASSRQILQSNTLYGITSLTYQEVLQGARSKQDFERLRRYLSTQLFYHPKHPLRSFEAAAHTYYLCRKRGVTVRSTIDCLIAQIAIEHDLLLLHSDRDFDAMAAVIPLKSYL